MTYKDRRENYRGSVGNKGELGGGRRNHLQESADTVLKANRD